MTAGAEVQSKVLASNVAATTPWASPPGEGQFIVTAVATWGGGTVKLQVQAADGSAVDIPDASSTADNTFRVFLSRQDLIRVNIATSTAVYVDIKHISWG